MASAADNAGHQERRSLTGKGARAAAVFFLTFLLVPNLRPCGAQSPSPLPDSLTPVPQAPVAPDSTRIHILTEPDDSSEVRIEAQDTLPPASIPRYVFRGPHSAYDSSWQICERRLSGPMAPMPPARAVAAGDLADWLGMFGPYDVDDAPGVGQNRFYTRWGLEERQGGWSVGRRPFVWQRLTFPQRAAVDAGVLPSFPWAVCYVGDEVHLEYDTLWSRTAHSSYFYRQGDFADTYSEGMFRRLIGRRLGIDLNFTFFDSDGRFADDNRATRFLRVRLAGLAYRDLHWSYQFVQFKDKTLILTPEPFIILTPAQFTLVSPRRNDLLWLMDFELYRPTGTSPGWTAGLRVQSGKQLLRHDWVGYRLASRDQRWTVWGRTTTFGWNIDGELTWEELQIRWVNAGRWGALVSAGRLLPLGPGWSAAVRLGLSDWDTDPPGVTATGVIGPAAGRFPLIPELRAVRERAVPSLFDRQRPREDAMLSVSGIIYAEAGEPALDAQWENAVSLIWHNGETRNRLSRPATYMIEARAAYVENYTRWRDTSSVETVVSYLPVSGDVRSVGVTAAVTAAFWRDFTVTTSYAAKYAATLAERRLSGYYPHKASAVLSWIRPELRWGIGVRANVIGLWMYGDRRIQPTLYTEPHIFRIDLSGTATMKSFHFNYLVQNIFNLEYRTRDGYPRTGRMVRLGIEWHFLD